MNYKKIFLLTFFTLVLTGAVFGCFAVAVKAATVNKTATVFKINKTSTSTLINGLFVWYTFDGTDVTATTVKNKATNASSATRYGNPVATIGKIGQAMKFDGTGDYLKDTTLTGWNTSAITISAWIKISAYPSNWYEYVAGNSVQGLMYGTNKVVFIQLLTAGGNCSSYCGVLSGYTLNANWHLITATWQNGSKINLYVDGSLYSQSAAAITGTLAQWAQVYVGYHYGATTELNGNVDDVRLYNRALSASEVKQLYQMSQTKINSSPTSFLNNGINTGLSAWYTMDGSSVSTTSVTDASGNSKTATRNGVTTIALGKLGQAMQFDGSSAYLSIPTSSINILSNFSVSAWVNKTSKVAGTNNDRIFSFVNDANNGFQLIYDDTSGKYAALLTIGGINVIDQPTYGIYDTGQWVHIAYVVSGSTGSFYRNGVPITAGTATVIGLGTGFTYDIGRRGDSIDAFVFLKGKLDDAHLYNRALSASEVMQLYKMGK